MTRRTVDLRRLLRLMKHLGREARGPGQVFLTGGASALLEGWRNTTIDVDLKLDPEPQGVFQAIASAKNELDINIELSSPDLFLPPLDSWREQSVHIVSHGRVDFFHYDFRAQALSKLARGFDRDLRDVHAMLERGLVTREQILQAFAEIEPNLIRYPSLDADELARRVEEFLARGDAEGP